MTQRPEDIVLNFGKHKGKRLETVPASYLLWLGEQNFCPPDVYAYYVKNKHNLQREVEEGEGDESPFCGAHDADIHPFSFSRPSDDGDLF